MLVPINKGEFGLFIINNHTYSISQSSFIPKILLTRCTYPTSISVSSWVTIYDNLFLIWRHFDESAEKVKFVYILLGWLIMSALIEAMTLCQSNVNAYSFLNSLWPSDAIWRQRSWSTLAQVMACCLTAPSHYLNQCWLIISEVQRHSPDRNLMRYVPTINR